MCSWITEKTGIVAHGKGVSEWISLRTANVYYDHPASAPLDHALIIDFLNETEGPGARVAVELSAESARALVRAIEAALAAGEQCHESTSRTHTKERKTETADERR
ncbi:MAG: hypothetical protein HY332_11750 [Chloroflexi bacterium]|nr:hypothetical protein [Chloroflexota bacterium]